MKTTEKIKSPTKKTLIKKCHVCGFIMESESEVKKCSNCNKSFLPFHYFNKVHAKNSEEFSNLFSHVDEINEEARGNNLIGTTKKGIGPAYEDKVGRRSIRLGDLSDKTLLEERVERLLMHHNTLLKGFGFPKLEKKKILHQLIEIAPSILPFKQTVWKVLDDQREKGSRILFEGAQGILLDNDHGTYPYVTSSNTVAGQATTGSGQGPKVVDYVLGITKAYTTRVGSGPFPTEQENKIGQMLGERGKEFGTVTGRKRRCGWFDSVLVRQAIKISGINGIALTKLDVLDGFDEILVCTSYTIDGEKFDYLPASQDLQAKAIPIYETLSGWETKTVGARTWGELPAQAIKYVRRIEELIEAPVALLSTSPERQDTILVHDPFSD